MQPRFEAGKIFLYEKALWLKDFVEELTMFPNSAHDDQVDAFAYISNIISDISDSTPKSATIKKSGNGITKAFYSL